MSRPTPLGAARAVHAAHTALLNETISTLQTENTTLKRKYDNLKSEFTKLKKSYEFYRQEAKKYKVALNAKTSKAFTGLGFKADGSILCGSDIDEYGSNFNPEFAIYLSNSSSDDE